MEKKTTSVFLLLGGNLGDREANLSATRKWIRGEIGNISLASGIYETKAWGVENQPDFLNQVIQVQTTIEAEEIMEIALWIEKQMGRIRHQRWHERTMDIDILFYGEAIINADNLQVPHPRLHERRFTLAPLAEIAPDFTHPVLKKTAQELLDECSDSLAVNLLVEGN